MNKKLKNVAIKKDQLLPEGGFIYFCTHDEASSHTTSRLDIKDRFLAAARKDKFIQPLLEIKESTKQNDGSEKIETVKYYSPLQIYLVLELSKNIIDEDGYLRDPSFIEWQKEKKFRSVNWGGGGSLTIDKKRKWERKIKYPTENLPLYCDYYHRFLIFLHSLEPKPDTDLSMEERRLFTNSKALLYNFEFLKIDGSKILKNYGLDISILNIIRRGVAGHAVMIDPLEHWYYYVKRHSQFKKDSLKGDAALAQELYRIYDVLTSIVETITGIKSEPLFDFLYTDITPWRTQKVEYQSGEDIQALKYAVQQFYKWEQNKSNKPFVSKSVLEKIAIIKDELDDYEKRYGADRSYAGNVRWYSEEENIKLTDLDEKTKWHVDNTLAQIDDAKVEEEIPHAIEHRLSDLQRDLRQILWEVDKEFSNRRNECWQKERDFGNVFWMTNREKLAKLSREEQMKLSRKEHDKIIKEAKKWDERGKEFADSVSKYVGFVFCQSCRKNPVQLHVENNSLNMWEASRTVICDECIKTGNLRSMEAGEWKCNYCRRLLYKFASNNVFNDLLKNTASVDINLEYGKMKIVIRCPNPKCKQKNQRIIEWGWLA